ncbi:MAG: hypothetical protein Aurels2KO_43870 [Aureliella sp.]
MDGQQEEEVQVDGLPFGVKLMMFLAGLALAVFVGLVVFLAETVDADKQEAEWTGSDAVSTQSGETLNPTDAPRR